MCRRLEIRVCLAIIWLLLAVFSTTAGAKTIYVDDDASGLNNGSNWENAYKYLQNALVDANSSPKPVEIRVAQGTYRPDEDTLHPNGTGRKEAMFQLINGVTVTGGYAGFGEADPNARDAALYQTILSGDIGKPLYKSDNSYHIFYHPEGLNLDDTAILNGFTITGGNANGTDWVHKVGGGMCNYESSPTVTNCTFTGNSAQYGGGGTFNYYSSPKVEGCTFSANSGTHGGGMNNGYSNPTVEGCTFTGNLATNGGGMDNVSSSPTVKGCTFTDNLAISGGGMFNLYSSPMVDDCTFTGNSASNVGGGMCNEDYSSPTVTNCTFSENSAKYCGGGMHNLHSSFPIVMFNLYSSPIVKNCNFSSNSSMRGGGMYNDGGSPTVEGCTFSGNSADEDGGGIYNALSSPTVEGCTFTGNSAASGGGMDNGYSSPTVTNCILWADAPSEIEIRGGTPTVRYSNVQGGWPGEGNLNKDPCFADPNNGDYHLKSQAGRWDVNEGRWTKDEVTSPCIDAGDPASPIGYEPFPNGGIINMGAYGGTVEASKSYFGEPVCETIVAGDINGDCIVDFKDFAIMAYHWLEEH